MEYNEHMAELDKLAEEHYSEFGFMTCTDEQMTNIIEFYLLSPINE
tara:strand:+ start:864 stop:1001 length:138 start_codon:yes stop_codon:yes gene_type:complete